MRLLPRSPRRHLPKVFWKRGRGPCRQPSGDANKGKSKGGTKNAAGTVSGMTATLVVAEVGATGAATKAETNKPSKRIYPDSIPEYRCFTNILLPKRGGNFTNCSIGHRRRANPMQETCSNLYRVFACMPSNSRPMLFHFLRPMADRTLCGVHCLAKCGERQIVLN